MKRNGMKFDIVTTISTVFGIYQSLLNNYW